MFGAFNSLPLSNDAGELVVKNPAKRPMYTLCHVLGEVLCFRCTSGTIQGFRIAQKSFYIE